jgi:hypothetical protein
MTKQDISINIPSSFKKPVLRLEDGSRRSICFSGGIITTYISNRELVIEPVLEDGVAYIKGPLTQIEVQKLANECSITPIAFEQITWRQGKCYEIWTPILNGKKEHKLCPSDLWSNIALHFARQRFMDKKDCSDAYDDITNIHGKTQEEVLCRSISLSLRCMDINVRQIHEFYNQKLVDLLSTGGADGRITSDISDQVMAPYIHSFFMHFGACRDHLAALIALRLEKKHHVNDMMRLLGAIVQDDFNADPILRLLLSAKIIEKNKETGKWNICGWLKDASELRKRFVHHTPYGAGSNEAKGRLSSISKNNGLYKFEYFILGKNEETYDVLDLIEFYYKNILHLFDEAEFKSGYDSSIINLTNKDIIDVKINS